MRTIILNITIRSASIFSSILLIYAVTVNLSPKDQGIYYLIQSVGSLIFFFDLGIGFVLCNISGNVVAQRYKSFNDISDKVRESLGILLIFSIKSTMTAAIIFVVVVGLFGQWQISKIAAPSPIALLLWWCFALGTAFNLMLGATLSFLEGMGYTSDAAKVRFIQAFSNALTFLALTSIDAVPYLIGISFGISIVFAGCYFYKVFGEMFFTLLRQHSSLRIYWRRDILPFQWRIAMSWVSGYFMFQAPTLMLASNGLLVDAGQYGLSMQIFLAISSVAGVYLTFCVPHWSALHVAGEFKGLFREYLKACVLTGAFVALCGVGLTVLSLALPFQYASRLLPPMPLAGLAVGSIFFQFFLCTNFYFRAQIKETLWIVSLFGATAMIISGFIFFDRLSVYLASCLYAIVGVLLGSSSFVVAFHKLKN